MTKALNIRGTLIGNGVTKICVPLTAVSEEELKKEASGAKAAGADLVEWRADFFEDLFDCKKTVEILGELRGILGQIPLLFTIRTKKDGGNLDITTKDYVNLNLIAAGSGYADLVDVEVFPDTGKMKELIRSVQETGTRVIASTHDFQKTDKREALLERFMEMDRTGADILKMAVMPEEFEDVAAIMQATGEMTKYTEKPLISMAMGQQGSISRIAGENFGSSVTFATVGAASAPGQFPIKELRIMMEALRRKNEA